MEESEDVFSLNDFRKWIDDKKEEPKINKNTRLVGSYVESKLSPKRLIGRMSVDNGEIREMAREFKRNGGTIVDVDDDGTLLVEVNSGTFRIPKYFVRVN